MLFRELRYALIFSFMGVTGLMGASDAERAEAALRRMEAMEEALPQTMQQLWYGQKHRVTEEASVRLADIDQARRKANDQYVTATSRIDVTAGSCEQKLQEALRKVTDGSILAQAAVKNAAAIEQEKAKRAFEIAEKAEKGRLAAQNSPEAKAAMKAQMEGQKDMAIAIEQEKIKGGIYDKQIEADKIKHGLTVAADERKNATKWDSIKNIFSNIGKGLSTPRTMFKVALGVAIVGASYYGMKHGMPVLIAMLIQPKVVSETSKKSWFGTTAPRETLNLKELVFEPALQAQLDKIVAHVKYAAANDKPLFNQILYGPPGTGKTEFARALALQSNVEYALTSGSEFAKIKDLNLANKELRKLLDWAKRSNKPLIIFIDEAESLFANRKLPGTSKDVTHFINTFLALVSDKSQKNLMFIFATNHPFKLDDAIANRCETVEFKLPGEAKCAELLENYTKKFLTPSITVDKAVMSNMKTYGTRLVGLAPRSIKAIAQKMVDGADMSGKKLTEKIADEMLTVGKDEYLRNQEWEALREKYVKEQLIAARAA